MTPEQITDLRRQKYNAAVVRLNKVHPDLMVLRVRPDFALPAHKPGQYSVLGLGFWEPRMPGCQDEASIPDETRLARRSYSISCSVLDDRGELLDPAATDWIEFYVVLVRKTERGEAPVLTPRLFMLREANRLYLGEKITGAFTLDPVKPNDAVVFLSTGTGEAPHNYMLWDLLRRGHAGPILSACCVRYGKDLAYRAVHEELMRRYPHYQYQGLTTREASNAGNKIYIQDLITSGQLELKLGRPLDPARTHVFLCGNPKMIGVPEKNRETGARVYPQPPGVIELLEKRGFQADQANIKFKGNIHCEEYW
ncbi:MAG TPA: ferredoxin--NADP reductase [Gemmataceae bacterium]|nr:ferredoxin--NADP reductase [Gemmataceae bacterium]